MRFVYLDMVSKQFVEIHEISAEKSSKYVVFRKDAFKPSERQQFHGNTALLKATVS